MPEHRMVLSYKSPEANYYQCDVCGRSVRFSRATGRPWVVQPGNAKAHTNAEDTAWAQAISAEMIRGTKMVRIYGEG